MEASYKITEVISNTPEKFTAMISFNGKKPTLHEVDIDNLQRDAVSLTLQRDFLSKQCTEKAKEFNDVSDIAEAEVDVEKKARLVEMKKNILSQANSLMAELNVVEAQMSAHASKMENRSAYIHEQLTKTAEMDAALIEQPTPVELSSDGKIVF